MKQRTNNVVVGVALGMVAGFAALDARADVPQGPRVAACWGQNSYGQSSVPAALGATSAIAAGWYHTIALKQTGSVVCWGLNNYGQRTIPNGLGMTIAVGAGAYHSAAVQADGSVVCWGWNGNGQCSVPAGLNSVIAIACGMNHNIALRQSGEVTCWGANDLGQCAVPARLAQVADVAAGFNHSVARRTDGTAVCWGANGQGQCSVPADVVGVVSIAAGELHTVAALVDGTVRCWGDNGWGQVSVPSGLSTVVAVGAGRSHTVAVTRDGAVHSWGWNSAGQAGAPNALGPFVAVSGGYEHTVAIRVTASANLRSGATFPLTAEAILDAIQGDTLLIAPWAADDETVDYRGKSIELRSTNAIARGAASTTLFANGARMSAPESIAFNGTTNIPTNAGITLASGTTLGFDGNTTVSLGGSILAQNDGSPVALSGSMTLATDAVFNPLAPVALNGTLNLLGGVVVANSMSTAPLSELVSVNGTINVDALSLGGNATCLGSTIVSDVAVQSGAQLAASGQIVGSLNNSGRTITTEDLVIVGGVTNNAASNILAQVGVLYITGNLVNNGIVFGNVITAPGYQGGGTGGTQVGDGIRVAGSVEVGPAGELRFVEDLWKFSVCGNMTLACASDDVRFNGAKLSLDGCDGTTQTFEATSRDLGCVASAFSGEETQVSLIGELDVVSGATVSLVDNFNNAPGKDAEVVYARGLTVQPGATLLTNGIKVVTRNALIQGTVDNPANICVVPDVPDPDVNGDGFVNGIDLAFILTYWGSSAPIADLNDDGIVGGADLTIVLSGWTG